MISSAVIRSYIFALSCLLLAACSSAPSSHVEGGGEGEEHGSASIIHFDSDELSEDHFAVMTVHKAPFHSVVRAMAQVTPSQSSESIITAKAAGIITFPVAGITEGMEVRAGQALFTITSRNQAEGNLAVQQAEAESAYNLAKSDYERKSRLVEEGIVSRREAEQAEADYHATEAIYNNLKSNFSSGSYTATAPVSGYVTQLSAIQGQHVEQGATIMALCDGKRVCLRAEVQPKDVKAIGADATAVVRPMGSATTYHTDSLGGRLLSIGHTTTGTTIPVTFEVDSHVLLPGTFVEVFIRGNSVTEVIAVPREAVIEEMGVYFVYVALGNDHYEKREVTIGATDGEKIEITSGLADGEMVVSRGAILVMLQQSTSAVDVHSGHAH